MLQPTTRPPLADCWRSAWRLWAPSRRPPPSLLSARVPWIPRSHTSRCQRAYVQSIIVATRRRGGEIQLLQKFSTIPGRRYQRSSTIEMTVLTRSSSPPEDRARSVLRSWCSGVRLGTAPSSSMWQITTLRASRSVVAVPRTKALSSPAMSPWLAPTTLSTSSTLVTPASRNWHATLTSTGTWRTSA